MKKFLVIQTAFIGDVVLALPVTQELRRKHPQAEIHFLCRKGNEGLLENHPAIDRVWSWDKKQGKLKNLRGLARELREHTFDIAYNLHRFASSGWLMWRIRAHKKVGFAKNPLAFFLDVQVPHVIPETGGPGNHPHEVQRNLRLLDPDQALPAVVRPKLYPSEADKEKIADWAAKKPYIVVAPASVWYTKQWHPDQWKKMLALLPESLRVYVIGGPGDRDFCEQFLAAHPNAVNLCGELSLLQSAALMRDAVRVLVNDSAPQHFASAMNAPTTALFCSTIPAFGFGPLAEDAIVAEVEEPLPCRPCGLHGHKACPEGHFNCALKIDPQKVVNTIGLPAS